MTMLKEISNCRNFLDFNKMIMLLNLLKSNPYSLQEIRKFFNDNAVILRNMDDTIILLEIIGILEIKDEICKLVNQECEVEIEYFIQKLLDSIIEKKIVEFSNLDNDCFLAIDYSFYALRNLLLAENIIENYPISNLYLLNSMHLDKYKHFMKRKFTKEQLIKKLEKQDEYGEQAELFVIDYEKKTLNGKSPILHVALEDAGAGYDIKSYLEEDSVSHNKFIEVKCFSLLTGKFFISRNEIEVSRKLKDYYFLYLVESTFTRQPYIIQNPYKKIFNNPKIYNVVESLAYDIPEIIKLLNIDED